jgi:hypothetical protein
MPSGHAILRCGLTSHSTRADIARMSSARLDASLNPSRRVNSGVRHASHIQESQVSCDQDQTRSGELNDTFEGRANNSFNPTPQ